MKTIKIEKEVTKEDVYVRARTPDELAEVERILEKTDLHYVGSEFSDSSCVVIHGGMWFKQTSMARHRIEITIPQLAELLGVEYPFKPKFEAGKWYIAEWGTNIFCHNGKFDEDATPCGYGVACDANWWVANGVGWDGDYREATPEEVKRALIAEAKRRYRVGDRVSQVNRYNEGSMYGEEPWVYKGVNEWLFQDNSLFNENLCLMLNGEWVEVIEEEKKLPTLEELIAEAKSKITVKSESYPGWLS